MTGVTRHTPMMSGSAAQHHSHTDGIVFPGIPVERFFFRQDPLKMGLTVRFG